MATTLVDLRLSDDEFDVFCPACGAPIFKDDSLTETPCKHVIFIDFDVGEFDYVAPQCSEIASQARDTYQNDLDRIEEALDWTDQTPEATPDAEYQGLAEQFLKLLNSCDQRPNPTNILSFGITTVGCACGPSGSRLTIAIDFEPPATQ